MDNQSLQIPKISILDLPTELIEHICCCRVLQMNDIFNLALSHSKLNIRLFHEQNSCLWKTKYIQKYGQLDKDEYKITIDNQNTWKEEIMMRMFLDKAVPFEIMQMPKKFMQFIILKNIPYHLYPFIEKLNAENQAHRYYVLSASAAYYKRILSDISNTNCDLLYVAHLFLIYSCQVYFGHKINDFLCLPPIKQTLERGFYLMGRWWSPTTDTPYCDINKHLNNIAITTLNLIQSTNPTHPLFKFENYLDQLIQRGKINLNYDLYDEPCSMFILDALRQVMFNDGGLVCSCNDIKCFLLQQVIEQNKGSVFLLCVIYESVARRLGVKVNLTATDVHSFLTWASSWPGNKFKNPTCYLIDIAGGGIVRKTSVCPVTRKLPQHFERKSMLDLFCLFSRTMEQLTVEDVATYKYALDFQKILRPNDPHLEFKYQKFHQFYDYCKCPLLQTSMSSYKTCQDN